VVALVILLIVQDRLQCGFAQFKLCAHLLDLRCLLVETRSKLRHGYSEILLSVTSVTGWTEHVTAI
jgi:hypothetical protein